MKHSVVQNIDNIRRLGLANNNLGASKHINDDWGTIAFLIPKVSLNLEDFIDPELFYNCIYFLIGTNGIKWSAYVGQAKKRNSGGSVLKRLREHAKSETESYRDKWDRVIVVTNKNDAWNLDDLNALENILYQEIPPEKNLNGNTPNSAGADIDKYIDKVKQIKSYIALLGIDIFEHPENIENMSITQDINENTPVEDLQNGLARIPEIVTPQKVVKAMVDMLPDEVWNSKTTFLDLACKGGEYLKEIYNRLMETESLKAEFPNEIARAFHILDKQLFGIALSTISLERTTNTLNGYSKNIKIIPDYIGILKIKSAGSLFADRLKEEFRQVKFDVVIGNPPYQDSNGGGAREIGGTPLYNRFIETALDIGDTVCMITKNNWMQSELLKGTREKMIKAGVRKIINYPIIHEVFNGVDVAV